MKRGTLVRSLTFKLVGKERHATCSAGHAILFERSPVDPGLFIVWHGKHYARVDARDLTSTVAT